jgi:hypothetical protein
VPFIKQFFRSRGANLAATAGIQDPVLAEMFATEVLQLLYMDPELISYTEQMDFDKKESYDFLQESEGRNEFFRRLAASKYISDELKKQVDQILKSS